MLKKIILSIIFISAIICSRAEQYSDYLNFELNGRDAEITKLISCTNSLTCKYYEDDLLVLSFPITTTTANIHLTEGKESYKFEFIIDETYLPVPIPCRSAGTVYIDDIDTKIEKYFYSSLATTISSTEAELYSDAKDYGLISPSITIYSSTYSEIYLYVNDYKVSLSCYLDYYSENELVDMNIKYSSATESLGNVISSYCKKSMKRLANTESSTEFMTLERIEKLIEDLNTNIYVYEMTGKQVSLYTKDSFKNLSAGIYIIKTIENNQHKTYKYIVK